MPDGAALGKMNLYVGRTAVKFNIPEAEAVDRLQDLSANTANVSTLKRKPHWNLFRLRHVKSLNPFNP
jgi:hypothetical protein